MIPTVEDILWGLAAGQFTKEQALGWMEQHFVAAEEAARSSCPDTNAIIEGCAKLVEDYLGSGTYEDIKEWQRKYGLGGYTSLADAVRSLKSAVPECATQTKAASEVPAKATSGGNAGVDGSAGSSALSISATSDAFQPSEAALSASAERTDELIWKHVAEQSALKDGPVSFDRLSELTRKHYTEMAEHSRHLEGELESALIHAGKETGRAESARSSTTPAVHNDHEWPKVCIDVTEAEAIRWRTADGNFRWMSVEQVIHAAVSARREHSDG